MKKELTCLLLTLTMSFTAIGNMAVSAEETNENNAVVMVGSEGTALETLPYRIDIADSFDKESVIGERSFVNAEKLVDLTVDTGLLIGRSEEREDLALDAPLTRAEGATLVVRAAAGPDWVFDVNAESGFRDVNDWSAGYIAYGDNKGIVAGVGNGYFEPKGNLTGYQFGAFLLRALGYGSEFDSKENWHVAVHTTALNVGIVDEGMDMSRSITRQMAAEMLGKGLLSYTGVVMTDGSYTRGNLLGALYDIELGTVIANGYAALDKNNAIEASDDVVLKNADTGEIVKIKSDEYNDEHDLGAVVSYIDDSKRSYIISKIIDPLIEEGYDEAESINDFGGMTADEDTEYYVNYKYMSETEALNYINNSKPGSGKDTRPFNLDGIYVRIIDNDGDGDAEYVIYIVPELSIITAVNTNDDTISYERLKRNDDYTHSKTTETVKVKIENVSDSSLEKNDIVLAVIIGGKTYLDLCEYVDVDVDSVVDGKVLAKIVKENGKELVQTEDATYKKSYVQNAATVKYKGIETFEIATATADLRQQLTSKYYLDKAGNVIAYAKSNASVNSRYSGGSGGGSGASSSGGSSGGTGGGIVQPPQQNQFAVVLESGITAGDDSSGYVKVLQSDGTTDVVSVNVAASLPAFGSDQGKLTRYLENEAAAGSVVQYTTGADGELTIVNLINLNDIDSLASSTTGWDNDNNYVAYIEKNSQAEFAGMATFTPNLQYYVEAAVPGAEFAYTQGEVTIGLHPEAGDFKEQHNLGNNTTVFYYDVVAQEDLSPDGKYYQSGYTEGQVLYETKIGYTNMRSIPNRGIAAQIYGTGDVASVIFINGYFADTFEETLSAPVFAETTVMQEAADGVISFEITNNANYSGAAVPGDVFALYTDTDGEAAAGYSLNYIPSEGTIQITPPSGLTDTVSLYIRATVDGVTSEYAQITIIPYVSAGGLTVTVMPCEPPQLRQGVIAVTNNEGRVYYRICDTPPQAIGMNSPIDFSQWQLYTEPTRIEIQDGKYVEAVELNEQNKIIKWGASAATEDEYVSP